MSLIPTNTRLKINQKTRTRRWSYSIEPAATRGNFIKSTNLCSQQNGGGSPPISSRFTSRLQLASDSHFDTLNNEHVERYIRNLCLTGKSVNVGMYVRVFIKYDDDSLQTPEGNCTAELKAFKIYAFLIVSVQITVTKRSAR